MLCNENLYLSSIVCNCAQVVTSRMMPSCLVMHVDANSTLHVPLMQLTEVFGHEVPSADQKIYLVSNCCNILQFVAISLSRPFRDRISEEPYNVFCPQRPCKLRYLCRHLSYSIVFSKTSRLI